MEKLTNENVVRSVSNSQEQILSWIIDLYISSGRFDYDPTYSKGNFYKSGIKQPAFKSCLTDEGDKDFIANAVSLPIKDECMDSICFDPPFVMGSGPSVKNPNDGSNLVSRRFGIFKNHYELFSMYENSIKEFYRVLKKDGVLVFKSQDSIYSAKQVLSHVMIINTCNKIGLYPKDIFVLTAKNRILSGKVKKQQHARKFHSYFLVFIKQTPKISYF